MGIDLELAKKHKEYVELEEKINPLRIEHNFLVDAIDILSKNKIKEEKYIKWLRDVFYKEKQERESQKEKENNTINSLKLALDSKKNTQKELYIKENEQLQLELKKTQNTIKESNKELTDIKSEVNNLLKEKEDIIKIKNDYEYEYNRNKKEIEEWLLFIEKEKKLLQVRENNVIKLEKEINKDIQKYNLLKKDVEEKNKIIEDYTMWQIKKEQELLKIQSDIDRKLIIIDEKEREIKETHIKSKEIMQQIEEKELKVSKTISEFQDEKYKFLVLMKQKWIKKSDIEDLDKEFNL